MLVDRFDESGIRSLAFGLGVDYEALSHDNKRDLSQALVTEAARDDKLEELEALIRRDRPEAFSSD